MREDRKTGEERGRDERDRGGYAHCSAPCARRGRVRERRRAEERCGAQCAPPRADEEWVEKDRGGDWGGFVTHRVVHSARPVTRSDLIRACVMSSHPCLETDTGNGTRGTGTCGAIRWASRAVTQLVAQRGRAPVAPCTRPPAPVAIIVVPVECAVGTGTSGAIRWAPCGSDYAV